MVGRRNKYWAFFGGGGGGGGDVVRFRAPYLEVDIEDMRPGNLPFGIIGRDGELQLHATGAMSHPPKKLHG